MPLALTLCLKVLLKLLLLLLPALQLQPLCSQARRLALVQPLQQHGLVLLKADDVPPIEAEICGLHPPACSPRNKMVGLSGALELTVFCWQMSSVVCTCRWAAGAHDEPESHDINSPLNASSPLMIVRVCWVNS